MAQPNRRDTGTGRSHVSDRARVVSSASHGTRGGTATRQSPPPQRAPPSPGRKHISDRQREASATRANLSPIKGRLGTKPRGMGLRAKFMLTLALATVVALGALGLSMWLISSKYLFSQKQHDGIEVAMATAQIATAVADQLKIYDNAHQEQAGPETTKARQDIARNVVAYITNAARWDNTAGASMNGAGQSGASDILAVLLDTPKISELSGPVFGPNENGTQRGSPYGVLFLPKNGSSINLPETIQVYSGVKQTDNGAVPVYRFNLALDPARFGDKASVWVDVDARGVDNVKINLMWTIFAAVGIAIVAVVLVANWLATNITSPVLILLKDMQAVARGDLEHNTKAHSTDEIGILAHEFNRMTMNLKEAQSALVEQEKAEYELSIAREVQKQLLPAEPPLITGFECADFYKGAKAVSGDYYDFIPLGNGLWGFIVADVSGKGIPGSMVMAVTRTIVRLIAVRHQNRAADTLKDTNRLIAKQIKRGMFVTSFYAVLDERSGQLTYASAGHNPMIIYRSASRSVELATGKGIALGFNEGPIFDKTIEEHRTVLGARDAILLYTDGFPEAMNAENQEFGEERFNQLVANFGHLDARTLIERLVAAVASHRGEAEQSDDLTLITVRRA